MRVLWIATKVPVPPVDGGRLVQKLTVQALTAAGVEVSLVAPLFPGEDGTAAAAELRELTAARCTPHLVPLAVRGVLPSLWDARPGGLPLALARHAREPLRHRVEQLLDADPSFDLVHAEQLHALPQAAPAFRHGVPVVLRAQNVESDLWRLGGAFLPSPVRLLARWEARRLAHREGEAVGRVAATVALTENDAARLDALAAAARRDRAGENGAAEGPTVMSIPAPFPAVLPAGPGPLAGEPPVVLLGSGGWPPNRDAADWMLRDIWPRVVGLAPRARLHLFGDGARGEAGPRVVHHPAPADSSQAFVPGAVLAVPLRVASGVRMKILEAWARGVPVVATPAAVAGLEAEDDRELLVAADAASFAAAIARLANEPALSERLVAAGREALRQRHAPSLVARRLCRVYTRVAARGRGGAAV